MMDTQILIWPTQADASSAVSKITSTMGLGGSTFLYAIPRQLADGRWFIPNPSDAKWLEGVAGYTVAASLGLAAVGEVTPDTPFVPATVTNFQARAVLMKMASLTGDPKRSMFDDINDTLLASGGLAWAAWEYANDVERNGVLVASLGDRLGLSGAAMDQLFIEAGKITA